MRQNQIIFTFFKRFYHASHIRVEAVKNRGAIHENVKFDRNLSVQLSQNSENKKTQRVIVKMIAAPIHNSDLNMIQGVYPMAPVAPFTVGNEGVGKVVECDSVGELDVGDIVIPTCCGEQHFGSWCDWTEPVPSENLYKIAQSHFNTNFTLLSAAVARANPMTAYNLLAKYYAQNDPASSISSNSSVSKSGENGVAMIQNGATSAVGIYLIQFARIMGIKSINIFRERANPHDTESVRKLLDDYGSDVTLTENEAADRFSNTTKPQVHNAERLRIRAAFNCTGGQDSVRTLLNALDTHSRGGSLVTYGGMAKQPMLIPINQLVFSSHSLEGYWLSKWASNPANSHIFRQRMDLIVQQFYSGGLKVSPFITFPFDGDSYQLALDFAMNHNQIQGPITKKVVFTMN